MGLDFVEIILEIEEEFCIVIPDNAGLNTMGDLQEFVVNTFSRSNVNRALDLLPKNGDDGKMPYDQYQQIWECFPWLPSPKGLFQKKRYERDRVVALLQQKYEYATNPDSIREKVMRIIKEILGLRYEPSPQDRLVEDLGCG